MARMSTLQRSAAESCELRNHWMSPFTTLSDTRAVATCTRCGMEVQVNTKPAPNEINIGGEAVALNCNPERRKAA